MRGRGRKTLPQDAGGTAQNAGSSARWRSFRPGRAGKCVSSGQHCDDGFAQNRFSCRPWTFAQKADIQRPCFQAFCDGAVESSRSVNCTSGKRSRYLRIAAGKRVSITEGGVPTVICPVSPRPARRVRSMASSKSRRIRRASSNRTPPASVNVVLRGCRIKTEYPSAPSSFWICCVSGGCAIPRRTAARPKCSSSATATKVSELPQIDIEVISFNHILNIRHIERRGISSGHDPNRQVSATELPDRPSMMVQSGERLRYLTDQLGPELS